MDFSTLDQLNLQIANKNISGKNEPKIEYIINLVKIDMLRAFI